VGGGSKSMPCILRSSMLKKAFVSVNSVDGCCGALVLSTPFVSQLEDV
jgi:hypothetical protein